MGGNGAEMTARRRSGLCLALSLGAVSLVLGFGILVALVGQGANSTFKEHVRWVQLSVGLLLIGLAVLHLLGKTERLPLIGRIMAIGGRAWEGTVGAPTVRSSYVFGAGFVAVGSG